MGNQSPRLPLSHDIFIFYVTLLNFLRSPTLVGASSDFFQLADRKCSRLARPTYRSGRSERRQQSGQTHFFCEFVGLKLPIIVSLLFVHLFHRFFLCFYSFFNYLTAHCNLQPAGSIFSKENHRNLSVVGCT